MGSDATALEIKTAFQRLRKKMMEERDREIPILQKIQSYRNNFLDWYFYLVTNLGEELFYILFLPGSCWFFGPKEAVHMVVCMLALCIGLGNILKNIFLIPRPPIEQVWTPEGKQKTDHGFPSTHTSSFLAAPIYFLIYQYYDKHYAVSTYPISLSTAILLFLLGSGSMIFSRLYCGYHSPLDILGGVIQAVIILPIWYFYLRHVLDTFIMWNSFLTPIACVGIGVLALALHPRPMETAAFPESGMLFGTCTGSMFLVIFNTVFGLKTIFTQPYVILRDSDYYFLVSTGLRLHLSRFVVGILIVACIRFAAKPIYTKLTRVFYPSEKDTNLVTAIVKFLNYFTISFFIGVWIPVLFHFIGLSEYYDLAPVTRFPTGYPKL